MDISEAIVHLGQSAGSKLKYSLDVDDGNLNKNLPYFHVDSNRRVRGCNYGHHDNADRMPFICNYLENNVFKFMDSKFNLQGFFNIELHDSYSYLNNNDNYEHCLTWSKRKTHHNIILMPDIYQLVNYGGKLELKDTSSWDTKSDKIGFYGTTTGDRDPLYNKRIQTCLWGRDNKSWCDFFIVKVAQIPTSTIYSKIPNFNSILHPFVNPEYLFKYKFLLDIPGNTCSWDRVPFILNSKSILFKMPCKDMCWYYPLLHNKEHYVSTNLDSLQNMFNFYKNNPNECSFITSQANKFVNNFLKPQHARLYLVSLFEEASFRYCR